MRFLVLCFVVFFISLSCKNNKESSEFFIRGNYHFKVKEYDTAEHFFSEAIKKEPELADAYNNRGLIYLIKGKTNEALSDFEKAASLDKTFLDAHYNLAKLYTELGRAADGEYLFKNLETKMDTSSRFHNAYGQNFVIRNKFSEGESHFRKALDLDKENVEAMTNLAYVKTVNFEYKEAEKLLEKALELSPNFVYALNNRAVIYGLNRDFSKAIELLEKAEKNQPKNIFVINNLALFALESGNLPLGAEKVDKAEKIEETNVYTLRNKGILALKSGKDALDIFLKIEDKNPEVDHIYYYLGETYTAKGDKVNACKNYKIGQKLNDPWTQNKCN